MIFDKLYNIGTSEKRTEQNINEIEIRNLKETCIVLYISAHKLYIETGRYLGILRHDRICTRCSINEVEDEQHYLFACPGMESKRKILYDTIEKSCINFKHLNNKNKLIWLLNTEDKNILLELCKFLCLI